jgi:hypothetical protein
MSPCGSLLSTTDHLVYLPQPVSVLGPAPTLSPSLAEAIFEPYLFPYKYPNILIPSYSSYLPACEDGTECCEMLAYEIQMPGNYPEGSIQFYILLYYTSVIKFYKMHGTYGKNVRECWHYNHSYLSSLVVYKQCSKLTVDNNDSLLFALSSGE